MILVNGFKIPAHQGGMQKKNAAHFSKEDVTKMFSITTGVNFKSIIFNASVEQKIARITCVESLNQRIRITVSVLIGFSGFNVVFSGENNYGPPEISDGT